MVIDTSAVVALLLDEPTAMGLRIALDNADRRLVSAATLVEIGLVVEGKTGAEGAPFVERLVREAAIEIIAFGPEAVSYAMDGWRRFGKGRHPAALNLGDCFTYALAAQTGEPILCVGNDFTQTDAAVVAIGP